MNLATLLQILLKNTLLLKFPEAQKNCRKACSDFKAEINGCFKGCSESDYYRTIESGIMRTLSAKTYGIFNENTILKEISESSSYSRLTGQAIEEKESCADKEFYIINGIYKNNKIIIKNIKTERGCAGGNGNGDFTSNLILEDGTIQQSETFNPRLIFTTDPINMEQGETYISNREFTLTIPKVKSFKSVEISQEETILTTINLQRYLEKVNFKLRSSTNYILKTKDKGTLDFIKLSGSVEGEGTVKIYLDNLLILDTSKFSKNTFTGKATEIEDKETNNICGNKILEKGEICDYLATDKINNPYGEKCNKECSIPGSYICGEKILQAGEICKYKQEDESNTGQTTGKAKTISFKEYCEETCDLKELDLNKEFHSIRFEISGAVLNLDEIRYDILQIE